MISQFKPQYCVDVWVLSLQMFAKNLHAQMPFCIVDAISKVERWPNLCVGGSPINTTC